MKLVKPITPPEKSVKIICCKCGRIVKYEKAHNDNWRKSEKPFTYICEKC